MLFRNVIPLYFSMPAITKHVNHVACSFAHCFKNSIWSFFSVLPIVTSVDTTKTSRRSDDTFAMLLQHLVIHARVTIEVLVLVALGHKLEQIVQTSLVLSKKNKMSAAA